jgi:hypothetical protein
MSTRGHEFEKGYIIKNVVTFLTFLVNNNVDAKSDIPSLESTYYVCVESLVQIGTIFNFFVELWPSITLTLIKFNLTEMNPSWAIPG